MRNTPYTDDMLLKAWNSFMEAHPKEHILVNTMRASRPSATSPGVYNIVVDNEHQMQLVQQWLPEITRTVRDLLKNDNFNLTVEKHEGEPRTAGMEPARGARAHGGWHSGPA